MSRITSGAPVRSDLDEIARALHLLFREGDVVEMRVPKTERDGTLSGYFSDHGALAKQLAKRNGDIAVYVTLNPVVPALRARSADRVKSHARITTSDHDIARRAWLLIDCDPRRPSGISATDGEHAAAIERARDIRLVLTEEFGWPLPILADSGNGAHLDYRIELPNDEASSKLLEAVLRVLWTRFSDAAVEIDRSVYNAARIVKAYGTVARKGEDLPERPHRLSRMLEVPRIIEPVPRELLEQVAGKTTTEAAATARARNAARVGRPARFSVEQWIRDNRLAVQEPLLTHDGGRKWVFEECPFDAEHKSPDAAIFESEKGKPGFKCFHNSCADYGWKELREHIEGPKPRPDAREHKKSPSAANSAGFGSRLLEDAEQYIRRYVVLPEPAYLPLALWAIGTHAAQEFDCYPYIALVSAAKRSGKTRLMEVLETLVHEPLRGAMPSPAALYRMLETGVTLMLDEVEVFNMKNKSETTQILLAVLNAGHRKGGSIARCEGPHSEVRLFSVYGPKLFAAIGRLPDPLMDRSIVVHMKRRLKAQPVERFRMARATVEASPIHEAAADFVQARQADIGQADQLVPDEDLKFLNDRDADIWTPLIAICTVLDPGQLVRLRNNALLLSTAKAGDDLDDSHALSLLRDIRTVWPDGEHKLETALLLERLKALEESPWQEYQLTSHKLARMLKPFEVEPRSIRISERTPKGYYYEHFKDAFDRYLDEKSATSATSQ